MRDVVLVTIDTLRWDAPGFMGNPEAKTPHLDRVARQGVLFERAWAHNVMTLPSHANILTGLLPFRHGIRDNAGFVLSANVPTAATLLKAAGFATAAVVSAFPLDARYGLGRGFDLYDDRVPQGEEREFVLPERRGDRSVEAALRWWTQASGTRRFLWLHLFDPHAPYEPPEPWRSELTRAPYLAEVAATDSYLGPLFESLDPETTLLAVTADHGEGLGDHGERTHGLFAYDATLRVPLVLWGAGLEARRVVEPVGHLDLLPTLLDAAGVTPPDGLTGVSLLKPVSDRRLYFEALSAHLDRDWAPLRGVVDGRHKFIDLPVPELYDLTADPGEVHNIYSERSVAAKRLRESIPSESAWQQAQSPDRTAISDIELRQLRSLGYLAGSRNGSTSRAYTNEDDPKNLVHIDQLMHRFMAAYQAGDLTPAEQLARQLVQEQPKMGDGHYHLAQVLLDQGRTPEALRSMLEAYRQGVRQPALIRQLALTLAEVGQTEQAIALLDPLRGARDPRTLNTLGLVLSEAGDQLAATRVLEQVFEIDERNPAAHQTLALVAVREGDWQRAIRQAQAAIALDDSLPLAWNYLGLSLYNVGRKTEAIDAWQTSLSHARDLDVLFNLAIVAAEVRDSARARVALEAFIAEAAGEHYSSEIATARQRLRDLEAQP